MWKAVLCLCVVSWVPGEAEVHPWMRRSMDNYTLEIVEEMIADLVVNETLLQPNISYKYDYESKFNFDMRAMGALYNKSEEIVDVIADKEAYPEGVVTVADGHLYIAALSKSWRKWLTHYAPSTAIITVAVLFAVILPISGVIWCCCNWCRSGKRRRPFDRENDACIRAIFAIILIILLTLFLFGVVCAFATETQVEQGAAELGAAYRTSVLGARQNLDDTYSYTVRLLTVTILDTLNSFEKILDQAGSQSAQVLGEFSNAMSITTLNNLVQQLDDVREDLRAVQSLTNSLRLRAVDLNSGLRKVKNQLLQTLAKCDQPKCVTLQNKYKIGELDTEIQYSQMPDVSVLLSNVSALLESGIKQEVGEGFKSFRALQRDVKRAVDQHVPAMKETTNAYKENLQKLAKRLEEVMERVDLTLKERMVEADELDALYKRYGPYRQYLGVGAAVTLLLIIVVMTWGLLVGVCGGRPEVYGANDCCTRAGGARTLLCGKAAVLLLGCVVAVTFLVNFITGVAMQRFVCDPLNKPQQSRLFSDVDRMVDLEKTMYGEHKDPSFNLSAVILRCNMNMTLYHVLSLQRTIDIDSALSSGPLLSPPTLTLPRSSPVTLLRPAARQRLLTLADSELASFDFDRILSALDTNMTSLTLSSLERQLNTTAASLQQPVFRSEARDLLRAAADLGRLNRDVLAPMLEDAATLNETALRLRDGMRPGGVSLDAAVRALLREADAAERMLNGDAGGLALVEKFITRVVSHVSFRLQQHVRAAGRTVRDKLAHCAPLSAAFNHTRDAVCVKLLKPIHGNWLALGWCMVLFVPLLLVVQRLAQLYRQAEPYAGPALDAEYLYDAYADRDNVPLANGSKRSTLDIEGKIAEWRERAAPSAPPPDAAPPAAGTRVLLAGEEVVCRLVPPAPLAPLVPPAALITDLKTRLDAKDEDNESGIHESDAYKAEKRPGREARDGRERGEARGGRGGGGGGAGGGAEARGGAGPARADSSLAPPLDAYHARRYNDMAPKHWEEGPPRYHGPTEYERPPPYYYPGPNDRQ